MRCNIYILGGGKKLDQANLKTNENSPKKLKNGRGWLNKLNISALIPGLHYEKQHDPSDNELATLLNKTIESQIIPRLLMQHSHIQQSQVPHEAVGPISTDEVKYFAELLIHSSNEICLGYIQSLKMEGRSLNEIYLDLIAPAARRLGCYWELDEQSFTTVTLALGRVQRIMQELSPDFRNKEEHLRAVSGKALLFAMPHSQHTMGVFMLGEFFSQAGWNVTTIPNPTEDQIVSLLSKESFDIVGISISYELQWDPMRDLIAKIRTVSANSQVGIMAGVALFNARPELVDQCTADICTTTAADAVIAAETILKSRV